MKLSKLARSLDPSTIQHHSHRESITLSHDNLSRMTESEKQPLPSKSDFLKSAAPWAETFSKSVAGIVIGLYACGFLIVSIYHSQFGFVGTNPFRPRVLAAGAWFLFLTAIPVSGALTFRLDSLRNIGTKVANIWIGCVSLSYLTGNLLFDYTESHREVIHLPTWAWVASAVVWTTLILLASVFKLPQSFVIGGSVILTLLYVVNPLASFLRREFDVTCLALWYFAVLIVAITEFKTRSRENLADFGGWAKPMASIFGLLAIFSQFVYPHLRASWGGGTPANITVYFSKDSLIYPNKSLQAQLIEESEEGFYLVGSKESKALFVPRSSVAMIYFSDRPADSPILQNNK
jgi:hypothetical protein